MSTFIILYTVTKDDLCVTGADDEIYNGKYEYFGTQSSPPGLIWYNPDNQQYLYPGLFSSGNVNWRKSQQPILIDIGIIQMCPDRLKE